MSSKTVIVKLHRDGNEFEIFVDADLAYEYITGKRSDPLTVLEAEDIFKDARKGERQSEEKIRKAFGTTELAKVAEAMLKHGEVPITTEQRNKLIEEKRKLIIEIIAKNSIDPRTNAPNPPLRIENAMREAKVSIDPFKGATEQIDDVVKKITMIMPIKFATVRMDVTIPAEYANRSYGTLKKYGLKSEKWLDNGSLNATLEFPAGMQTEFFDRINSATQGKAVVKII
ncbi:MAG: ribosome assembly factor SBDS [Candidatus Micrarchaeaceae archaeon]|jgi:ribosome maturation protein SDO1|nr:ribosome assembly factor SBDS [Candidatus Micrarchaeota archaeon]HII09705.1 ribosome assembly factor SBDS [Candidatus Micrarchaeota archaeon]